jgi:hypothetical protein
MVRRLSAGGSGIRTAGPPYRFDAVSVHVCDAPIPSKGPFRCIPDRAAAVGDAARFSVPGRHRARSGCCDRMVLNSASARACALGMVSRTVRISQYSAVCRVSRIWLASGLRQLVRSEASRALCNLMRFSARPQESFPRTRQHTETDDAPQKIGRSPRRDCVVSCGSGQGRGPIAWWKIGFSSA